MPLLDEEPVLLLREPLELDPEYELPDEPLEYDDEDERVLETEDELEDELDER